MADHHEKTAIDIDSPLTKVSEDSLGRGAYAARVADMIAGSRGDHSAVFAIYGEWGSGKTSFKNFILENLSARGEPDRPVIVEFNPWEWEGPRQVTEAFFARLVEEIGGETKGGAEVADRLSRYATYFTLGASIADSAAVVLPWLVPGAGNLATLFSAFLKKAGEQAKVGADAKQQPQSLSRARTEVVQSIRALGRTVLVTIDDVDRLTSKETAILFQLLKANADFPHVVYLVLCDREVVQDNLGREVGGHGDDYLEKIVQLGLPLPKAYPEQLRTALLNGLQNELRKVGVERLLDNDRLVSLFDEHASRFFGTMRDVKRFLANISTLLPAITRNGQCIVDLVDFIGIEMLRMFDHDFYEAIYCYRARITGREGVPSKDKEFVQKLAGERDLDGPALGVFGELFTRFGPARKFGRVPGIGHARTFDRYFLFAVPPDQYSPAEERDILAGRGGADFAKLLQAARDAGRLQHLLEILGGTEPPHESENVVNYLSALATFADTLHINDGADEDTSYRDQLDRLAFTSLKPLDPAQRAHVLVGAVERSQAIAFPARFEEHFRERESEALTDAGKKRLKELTVDRLKSRLEILRVHPSAGELLLWWLDNGGENEAKAAASEMLRTDESLLDFIRAFSHRNVANIGKARKRVRGFTTFAREMNRIVPIQRVLARVDELDADSLTPTQQALIRALREDAKRMAETDEATAAQTAANSATSAEDDDAK